MFSYLRSSVAEAEKLISHEAGGVKQTINNWQYNSLRCELVYLFSSDSRIFPFLCNNCKAWFSRLSLEGSLVITGVTFYIHHFV